MGLILILIGSFIMCMIFYNIFDCDIFSPSVLFSCSYLLSAVCCLYNMERWGVNLNLITVLFILLSLITFAIGEFIVKEVFIDKRKKTNNVNRDYPIKIIKIGKVKVAIVALINIVLTILLYKEIVRIANINYQEWGNLIYNFKTNSNSNLANSNISGIVTQGLKITKGFAYVFLFAFINNMIINKKFKKIDWVYLLPVLFVCIQSLLKGVRVAILTIIISGLFIYYFIIQYNNKWRFKINFKKVFKVLIIGIVICISFYQAKNIVGRQQDDMGVITYVTTYLGGNIQLFDQYIKDNTKNNNGNETFSGLITSLQKMGIFKDIKVSNGMEYRTTPTGEDIGNVYGAVRNYYNDYGVGGIIICFFIMSIIINLIYYSLKIKSNYYINDPFMLIFYSTLVYGIFFLTFYDFIYAKLAIGSIIEIILLWMCKKYILDLNIKFKI